ncbi:MAG: hypothetical protein U0893_02800 [Chloroflexota bacterium]
MSDLAIAGMILGFFVGLAIAAPIWGYDSRDGIESDQPSRRVTWLYDRPSGHPQRSAGVALAGALRSVAYTLDAESVARQNVDPGVAEAC